MMLYSSYCCGPHLLMICGQVILQTDNSWSGPNSDQCRCQRRRVQEWHIFNIYIYWMNQVYNTRSLTHITVKIDLKNTFNIIHCDCLLDACHHHTPSTYILAYFKYASLYSLICVDIINSECCVQ